MQKKEKNGYFFIIASIAAIAGILFGYDTGVVSGAILFLHETFQLTAKTNGMVVSAVLFGALCGALMSGRLADRLGRKFLLLADACIFIAGTLLTAFSQTITLIILGRMIVGIAIGIASYVAPVYISEIAPAQYRGILVSLNQLAVTLGILLSYFVDWHFAATGAWRSMFLVGVIPAIIFLIGLCYLPDSPRWFVAHHQSDKALAILLKIYRNRIQALKELSQIEKNLSIEQHTQSNWRQLFTVNIRSTLIVGIGLAVLQQATGINTIIYYAPTLFRMAGFTNATTAILATMGIGVIFVLFTLIALPLIDTIGRRPLLLAGLTGMSSSLFMLGIVFLPFLHMDYMKWAALGSMLVFIACFAFSLGPIMWLMIAEIYPLRVRGLGSSLATAANWGSNMLVALTFLSLIEQFGTSNTFFIYGFISFLGILFIWHYVPETRAMTLEQIEAHLETGQALRHLGRLPLIT